MQPLHTKEIHPPQARVTTLWIHGITVQLNLSSHLLIFPPFRIGGMVIFVIFQTFPPCSDIGEVKVAP
jgi:hypothetical protein